MSATVYWVCVDCYFDAAEGGAPVLIGGQVAPGLPAAEHAPDCPVWLGDPDRADVPVAGAECECEHDEWSRRPCEGCGWWKAGAREAVTHFDD